MIGREYERRWSLHPDVQELIVEQYDDGAMLFNPATRRTHALAEVAVAILETLQVRGCCSAVAILQELFGEAPNDGDPALQSIDSALGALAGEQLIVVTDISD